MKIKEISIKDYGPIKDFILNPGYLECIFGLNESGKTAIVEVLSYLLLKRSTSLLRYGKPKNAFVKIEDAGTTYILPSKKTAPDLPPSDLAQLLYVRSSESTIYDPKKKERFWDTLKTIFSNIGRDVTFAKLDTKIFEVIELQPVKLEWEKHKQNRIQNEQQRINDLREYILRIGEVEKKEPELAQLIEESRILKRDVEVIGDYKKYKKYTEVAKLYSTFLEKKIHLQEYERYKYDYLTQWQELETKKKLRSKDEKKFKEVKQEIIELEKELMDLKRKENIIEIEEFKSFITRTQEDIKEPPIMYPAMILCAVTLILILSFFLAIPKIPVLIIFTISLAIFIILYHKKQLIKKALADKSKWLKRAKMLFPNISCIDDLTEEIEATQKMKLTKETLLNERRYQEKELLKQDTIPQIERAIADLRNKTGLAELSDLKTKLDKKRELEEEFNRLNGKIYGILSEGNDKKWESMIKKMKTQPPGEEPDITEEERLKMNLEKKQERIDTLKNEMKVFREIQQTKYNIKDDRSAFIEYDRLQKQLENYELEKKAALSAREILKKMSSELDEYIQHIIKGNESLSEYFKLVTDRYDAVEIKNKNFIVTQKNAKEYKIDNLSRGTKDQLLLCFRMAALKKIYSQGSFLLLDDAFIFADWRRRQNLMILLKKFIQDGNQVIYLTSDDHTRELFKENGARITTL